jgi:hypothetical protein
MLVGCDGYQKANAAGILMSGTTKFEPTAQTAREEARIIANATRHGALE